MTFPPITFLYTAVFYSNIYKSKQTDEENVKTQLKHLLGTYRCI